MYSLHPAFGTLAINIHWTVVAYYKNLEDAYLGHSHSCPWRKNNWWRSPKTEPSGPLPHKLSTVHALVPLPLNQRPPDASGSYPEGSDLVFQKVGCWLLVSIYVPHAQAHRTAVTLQRDLQAAGCTSAFIMLISRLFFYYLEFGAVKLELGSGFEHLLLQG